MNGWWMDGDDYEPLNLIYLFNLIEWVVIKWGLHASCFQSCKCYESSSLGGKGFPLIFVIVTRIQGGQRNHGERRNQDDLKTHECMGYIYVID